MEVKQMLWTSAQGWEPALRSEADDRSQFVMVFGATRLLQERKLLGDIRKSYPKALLLGCSTAGEIEGIRVLDNSLVVTAVHFDHTEVRLASTEIRGAEDSYSAGARIAGELRKDGLVHVFALSDGLSVNGSELVKGLAANIPEHVQVTGGLAGDADRFRHTLVLHGEEAHEGIVAVVGFYGDRLKASCGSLGGWDPFGPERRITRSRGNVLYELDGQSALDLYENYLGKHAKGLPATGLLFPLSLRTGEDSTWIVRTILSVDREEHSLTFAGDVPEGSHARLMMANFDRLIDGAAGAARATCVGLAGGSAQLAVLISCVGRKLILKQRVEEEVEGVQDILGQDCALAGFYSYGEISPFTPGAKCELHNQTMTITAFMEG